MRPLFHPSVKDITVEGILYALSDPVRVRIFASIRKAESAQTCACFLKIDDRDIPKATLSQHFKILREAGLIRSERCGVQMHNTTRCDEIRARFGKMVGSILEAYGEQGGARRKRKAASRRASSS